MSNILLTPEEVKEPNRLCRDPFMELGMTLRPEHLQCFERKIATHSVKVIILFEKHENAEKWNSIHEAHIRKGGHLATIALTALIGTLDGAYIPMVAAGSTASILKDEVQARIWYPKMHKGWLLTRNFIFRYEQFPGKDLYMEWTDIIQDDTGKDREWHKHGQCHCRVGGAFGIPEKLVRDLMTRFPLHTIRFK